MKKAIAITTLLVTAGFVNASPILWDINKTGSNPSDAADFVSAGVTEDLTGATVQNVDGSASMTDANGVTLTKTGTQGWVGPYSNDGVASSTLIKDYITLRDNTEAAEMQISGLSAQLAPNTEYSFYVWGMGDADNQNSTFTFNGTTTTITAGGASGADGSGQYAKFGFTTDAVVADTLDFSWNNDSASGGRYAALNGFAIVAIPEPATLGLIAVFGGSLIFIRRVLGL